MNTIHTTLTHPFIVQHFIKHNTQLCIAFNNRTVTALDATLQTLQKTFYDKQHNAYEPSIKIRDIRKLHLTRITYNDAIQQTQEWKTFYHSLTSKTLANWRDGRYSESDHLWQELNRIKNESSKMQNDMYHDYSNRASNGKSGIQVINKQGESKNFSYSDYLFDKKNNFWTEVSNLCGPSILWFECIIQKMIIDLSQTTSEQQAFEGLINTINTALGLTRIYRLSAYCMDHMIANKETDKESINKIIARRTEIIIKLQKVSAEISSQLKKTIALINHIPEQEWETYKTCTENFFTAYANDDMHTLLTFHTSQQLESVRTHIQNNLYGTINLSMMEALSEGIITALHTNNADIINTLSSILGNCIIDPEAITAVASFIHELNDCIIFLISINPDHNQQQCILDHLCKILQPIENVIPQLGDFTLTAHFNHIYEVKNHFQHALSIQQQQFNAFFQTIDDERAATEAHLKTMTKQTITKKSKNNKSKGKGKPKRHHTSSNSANNIQHTTTPNPTTPIRQAISSAVTAFSQKKSPDDFLQPLEELIPKNEQNPELIDLAYCYCDLMLKTLNPIIMGIDHLFTATTQFNNQLTNYLNDKSEIPLAQDSQIFIKNLDIASKLLKNLHDLLNRFNNELLEINRNSTDSKKLSQDDKAEFTKLNQNLEDALAMCQVTINNSSIFTETYSLRWKALAKAQFIASTQNAKQTVNSIFCRMSCQEIDRVLSLLKKTHSQFSHTAFQSIFNITPTELLA